MAAALDDQLDRLEQAAANRAEQLERMALLVRLQLKGLEEMQAV